MKEMCWLPYNGNQTQIALHLREYPHQPWRVYTASPHFVPDYPVPGGSKGWATFQKLRQVGWTIISSEQAKSSTSFALTNSQKN
ncbi:MAG: hypothetical protein ACRC2S_05140 [Waterburya sp.]